VEATIRDIARDTRNLTIGVRLERVVEEASKRCRVQESGNLRSEAAAVRDQVHPPANHVAEERDRVDTEHVIDTLVSPEMDQILDGFI